MAATRPLKAEESRPTRRLFSIMKYTFTDPVTGIKTTVIDKSKFEFKAPPGVQVIRNR